MMAPSTLKRVRTATLEIAYEESGPNGTPVLLLHGWPYAPQTYDQVVPQTRCRRLSRPRAVSARLWTDTLSLRETPRSGQQAALGNDPWLERSLLEAQRTLVGTGSA